MTDSITQLVTRELVLLGAPASDTRVAEALYYARQLDQAATRAARRDLETRLLELQLFLGPGPLPAPLADAMRRRIAATDALPLA